MTLRYPLPTMTIMPNTWYLVHSMHIKHMTRGVFIEPFQISMMELLANIEIGEGPASLFIFHKHLTGASPGCLQQPPHFPIDTGRIFNQHKMPRRCPAHLLRVSCTFN